ncbi:hypothetical protein HOL52_01050 [bacterium]|jgi:hypothetical protein|nr:hypothetical protein [bacterium]
MTIDSSHGEKYLYSAYPGIRELVVNKRKLIDHKFTKSSLKAKFIIQDFLIQLNLILTDDNSKDWYFSYFQDFCIQKDAITDATVVRIFNLQENELPEIEKHKQNLHKEYFNVQRETAYMWFDLIFNSYMYPTWVKYWALRGLEKMAFNANRKKIIRRKKNSLLDFPEIIPDVYHRTMKTMEDAIKYPDFEHDNPQIQFIFSKEYKNKKPDFSDVYSYFYQEALYDFQDLYTNTDGIWIDYSGLEDSYVLYSSLLNYPVAWCIKNLVHCRKILEDQTISIFYTQDSLGNFKIPRMAIVYTFNQDFTANIEQFRGVEEYQNLDIYMYKEQSYLDKFLEIKTSDEFLQFLEEVFYMINIVETKLLNPKFVFHEKNFELLKILLNEEFRNRFSFISKERIKIFLDQSKK